MLVRIYKTLGVAALMPILCGSLWSQQQQAQPAAQGQAQGQPQKNWKDRAEFDLYEAATKEQNAAKKLDLLNQWKTKYPSSEFEDARFLLFVNAYQLANQPMKMVEVSRERLTKDPKDLTALYWIVYFTPDLNLNSPENLDSAEKASRALLDAEKPASTPDAEWQKARPTMEALSHKTLGWIAMMRKDAPKSQESFEKTLQLNPGQAAVSYWLGQVIAGTKNVEQYPKALYHFARAASLEGPGALPPEGRKQVEDYLNKAYPQYHGSNEGLPELKAKAKTAPLPPSDFKIKSVKEIAEEKLAKEEEFKKNNPEIAFWTNLKDALKGTEGEQYFNTSMKDAAIPNKMRGKLVSQSPPVRPTIIVLAMSDDTTPELTLKLDTALPGKADAGTVIEFTNGVAKSYTKEPFGVVMEVEKQNVSGWPVQAAPPKKPAPAKRKPAR